MNKLVLSLDMDWAPVEVVEYTLSMLEEYDITATLFMTNKLSIDFNQHELAIHPNFTSLDLERHIAERMNDFPEAIGTRSHSLFFTERLREVYRGSRLNTKAMSWLIYNQG